MECASIRNCKYRCVPCSLEDFLSIMHFVLRSFGKYSIFFFFLLWTESEYLCKSGFQFLNQSFLENIAEGSRVRA